MNSGQIVLIDTNIVNYILKKSEEFKQFEKILFGKRYALSFATVAESVLWKLREGLDKTKLLKAMEQLDDLDFQPNLSTFQPN